ncbi:MAG: hypothetical protein QNK23_10970 [Crocinitomicaceae bacterium]|nr:hypothetical protein [Crocinitomicaceae bacterium]
MKKLLYITGCVFFLVSCGETEVEDGTTNGGEDVVVIESIDSLVQSEGQGISNDIVTLFDEVAFSDPRHLQLLAELEMCDSFLVEGTYCAPCSPENYKIFPFRNDVDVTSALMVQIKAGTILKGQQMPLPVRHLLVFERENGYLVKINGFRGNLIGTSETTTGKVDIMVRFYIPEDEAFMNCLFRWDEQDQQYRYRSVEVIEGEGWGGTVKAEAKDSVSVVVYQSLMSNSMLF